MKNIVWIVLLWLVCTQSVCGQINKNHYQNDLDSVYHTSPGGDWSQLSFIKEELSKKLTFEDRSYLIKYAVDSLAIAKNNHCYLMNLSQDDLNDTLIRKVYKDFISKMGGNMIDDYYCALKYLFSLNNLEIDLGLKNKYRELKLNQHRIYTIERFYVVEKQDIEVMSFWYDDVVNAIEDKSFYIDDAIYGKIFLLLNNKYDKMVLLMLHLIIDQPEREVMTYDICGEKGPSKSILLYSFVELFSYSPYGFPIPHMQKNDFIMIKPDYEEFTMSVSYQERVKSKCKELLKQYKQAGNSFKQYELR